MSPRDATHLSPRKVYERRFAADRAYRNALWQVLCRDYFQRFVPETGVVLEVAAGYCEFINHIRAARRIAVDINEDTRLHAAPDVQVILTRSVDLSAIDDGTVDVVFLSNFLEHITKPEIATTLQECRRVLAPGGRLLILQPNIRYVFRDYWMFWDHITPIDDRALCELLEILGFEIERVLPRFLPFTTKSRLPRALFLVRLYLRLPVLYRLFGGQALVVGRK